MRRRFATISRMKLYGVGLGIALGLACGVGGFTFIYAKGGSYLTNDPAACANCHIMQDHYDAWIQSTHSAVAVCNDCHVPKEFPQKYMAKLRNGWEHSYGFTTGWYDDPLQIKEYSLKITENSCRKCHEEITHAIEMPTLDLERISCVSCHSEVGHPL